MTVKMCLCYKIYGQAAIIYRQMAVIYRQMAIVTEKLQDFYCDNFSVATAT